MSLFAPFSPKSAQRYLVTVADDLLNALDGSLPAGLGSGYVSGSEADDIYEAWAWVQVISLAVAVGWSGRLENIGGPPPQLTLRRGPGVIYSPTPFTYAVLTAHAPDGAQRVVEVHLGVKVSGLSGVGHEMDVVVLDADGAARARTAGRHPTPADVVLQLECKLLSGNLKLPLARQLVGLATECLLGRRGHLVSRFGASSDVEGLLRHYQLSFLGGVFPGLAATGMLHARVIRDLEHYRLS